MVNTYEVLQYIVEDPKRFTITFPFTHAHTHIPLLVAPTNNHQKQYGFHFETRAGTTRSPNESEYKLKD